MALELYPRQSCFQHENHLENTPSPALFVCLLNNKTRVGIPSKTPGTLPRTSGELPKKKVVLPFCLFVCFVLFILSCMLVCWNFIHTLEIIQCVLYTKWLLVVWLREFRHTLEIITRTLREVVNRVRLCGHHTRGCSSGEVHACMLVCGDFICTLEIIACTLREVVNRERLCGTDTLVCGFRNFWGCQTPCTSSGRLYACIMGFRLHSGDHHAYFTGSLDVVCLFVCLFG